MERLEARGLMERLNVLPLPVKALAIKAKKEIIGPDWFTCPPEAIVAMRAKLDELEREAKASA